MRVARVVSTVVLALILASAAPAWAAPPTAVFTDQGYDVGAAAGYRLPTGAWWVNFGTARSSQDGQQFQRASVTAGIYENSCSPDGRTCSVYMLEGTAVIPAGAITIDPDLDRAILAPVQVTTSGSACTLWFDDTLGDWTAECNDQFTQTTTVSATLTATGPAQLLLDHETTVDNGSLHYRYTMTSALNSRPAAATVSAFGRTSSDPTSELTGARIARELNVGAFVSWDS
jgi:hypothetical protein